MRLILAVATTAILMCASAGAQQEPLLLLDFEQSTDGIISFDTQATVACTDDPEVVYSGERSLQVDYLQEAMTPGAARGFPGALVVPVLEPSAGLKAVSFAIATALSTPIGVILTEGEEGPRYSTMLWCNAGAWHDYTLPVDEFLPDLDGPVDPNGQLDVAEVQVVTILDADSFLRALTEATPLFSVTPAQEQTLWLDDFALLREAPEVPAVEEPPVAIADYAPPLRGFACIGGQDVNAIAEEQDGGGYALRVDYSVPAGTIFAVMHLVRPGALADMGAIRLDAATNRPTTLAVSLEERWGPGEENKASYYTMVTLEAGGGFETLTIPISSFNPGEDAVDPNGRLDMDQVATVMVGDAGALLEGNEVINSLWLRNLVAIE